MHHDRTRARLANASDGRRQQIGGERGGNVLGRRARMSFGPGGIARELIDLVVEADDEPVRLSRWPTLACSSHLPHHL